MKHKHAPASGVIYTWFHGGYAPPPPGDAVWLPFSDRSSFYTGTWCFVPALPDDASDVGVNYLLEGKCGPLSPFLKCRADKYLSRRNPLTVGQNVLSAYHIGQGLAFPEATPGWHGKLASVQVSRSCLAPLCSSPVNWDP